MSRAGFVASYLRGMVANQRRHCRENGYPVLPEVDAIAEAMAKLVELVGNLANPGQERTFPSPPTPSPHTAAVPPLAYDLTDAGWQLGRRSARTVRRLIDAGELDAVRVAGTRVVTRQALEDYLDRQKGAA